MVEMKDRVGTDSTDEEKHGSRNPMFDVGVALLKCLMEFGDQRRNWWI